MESEYKNNFLREFENKCKDYTYVPLIIPEVETIIAFGDIHGDYKMAVKLLLMSGVAEIIDEKKEKHDDVDHETDIEEIVLVNNEEAVRYNNNDKYETKNHSYVVKHENRIIKSNVEYKMRWIGGKTHVVQVGDQIDRCRVYGGMTCDLPETTIHDENSDVKIMRLFTDLHEQAVLVGGAVISLFGNHELNNALGDMTYVSMKGIDGFKNYVDPKNKHIKFNDGRSARVYAFKPGHEIGTFMGCTRTAAVVIGSNLFAHAGIVNGLIKEQENHKKNEWRLTYNPNNFNKQVYYFRDREGFENINIAIKKWLIGIADNKQRNVDDLVRSTYMNKSMFWNRILGSISPNVDYESNECKNNIDKVLKLFRINNIIVGHTPQSMAHNFYINATCGKKVWRIDVASSSAFDRYDEMYIHNGNKIESRRFQYLKIVNDKNFYVCFEDKCMNA